jgi:DNA-binding MarR family transcriptional regulator
MEQIKGAFSKVKQDIDVLREEINFLKEGLKENRQSLIELCELIKKISIRQGEKDFQNIPTHPVENSTNIPQIPTHPTHFMPLKEENLGISTGNGGVPTDKQTNQQTNQQTGKSSHNQINNEKESPIIDAVKILDSLDSLKKEIRLKFKRLTDQEMTVFSALYQACEEEGYTDYRKLAQKLKLTESSIRDYVGRLIKKGIPVEKIKVNNKNIQLILSPSFKKVASLSTILQLREL